MTSKKIIAAIAILALTASVMAPAMATSFASWQKVTSGSVVPQNSQTTKLTLTAADIIPKHTSVLGGFAWIYSGGPNTAFAVTTHNGARDSNQNPNGWHAHNVLLAQGTGSSDACIAGVSDDTTAGISIQGNTLTVNERNSTFTGSLSGAPVAFSIQGDGGCSSGLGIKINP
ncbi:MAG: hypothetical protein KGH76_06240 [Thaumarchaeota archaeon]|nr:hypothetical protein [Nitrososphaerota archaeon]MDE1842974.1 hypothetical protein [Nitrososphaerota archaeon]